MSTLRTAEGAISGFFDRIFGRMFRGNVEPVELARKLAREMEDHKTVSVTRVYVPNEYVVYLSQSDRDRFKSFEASLTQELAVYITERARHEGFTLLSDPVIRLETDPDLTVGAYGIACRVVDLPADGSEPEPQLRDEDDLSSPPPTAVAGEVPFAPYAPAADPVDGPMMDHDEPEVDEAPIEVDETPLEVDGALGAGALIGQEAGAVEEAEADVAAEVPDDVAAPPAADEALAPEPEADDDVAAPIPDESVEPPAPEPEPEAVDALVAEEHEPQPEPEPVPRAEEPPVPAPPIVPDAPERPVVAAAAPPLPPAPEAPARPLPPPGGYEPLAGVSGTQIFSPAAADHDEGLVQEEVSLIVGGRRHRLSKRTSTIGRSRDCDVAISDPNASRMHAEVRHIGLDYFLVDLGSTNGTYVNGQRVRRHALADGDRVTIGTTEMIVEHIMTGRG